MKKGLLLAGAVFSLGIFAESAKAVTIRVNEEQVLKFGFRGIIDAKIRGDRGKVRVKINGNPKDVPDTSDIVFSHREARIWAKYKLNKIISFGFQAQLGKAAEPEIFDSFINLAFTPEFNIIAGSYKVPFERHSGLQSGWTIPFPTGPAKGDFTTSSGEIKHVFTNPMNDRLPGSDLRSPGLTLWGNIADGMFKYYVGIFDGSDELNNAGASKTGLAIRVQFTPTMLGYKPEKGYVLKNTYVGKKDVLTVGVSYALQPYRSGGNPNVDDQTSWGIDLMWEQKFGTLVPNFQIGYVNHSNWRGTKDDDRFGWLVQGQLLYDQKVFLGKPAIVAKYVRSECDGTGCKDSAGNKPKLTTWGIGVNYYIKGPTNRISLAIDNVKIDDINKADLIGDDSYTDVTLSIFYSF